MVQISLDKITGHAFDAASDRIAFKVEQDGREAVLHCSPEGLARLLTVLLTAAKESGERTGTLIDLPKIPSERIAFMTPSAFDLRRPPKSDGSLLLQAGDVALEVMIDSVRLDILTQALNRTS